MIIISNAAQKHFIKLLKKQKEGTQIRLFVNNPGTLNAECGICYCSPDTVKVSDVVLKFGKLTAYIDEISVLYLEDAEIDLIDDGLDLQLTFKAPHAKIQNISNNASLLERVDYFLKLKIAPKISSHGGQLFLTEITDDGYAIIQFSGGCNGCSMANITLKEGIEKQLLYKFPELKGVRDLTKHKRGKHSYY